MTRLKTLFKVLLTFAVVVLIGWLIWNMLFNPITTIFNVTVKTERIEFTTIDNNNSRIVLHDASIATNDSIIYKQFEGTFELGSNVDVTIERIAEGPIILIMTCSKCKSVGKLFDGEDGTMIYKAKNYLDFVITDIQTKAKEGISYIFKIDGKIEIGRNVALELFDESNAILRSGKVVLIGSSKFSNNCFEAGFEQLNLGDRLVFDNQESKGFGFVVVNEKAGMEAAYRVESKKARIIRPGPQKDRSGLLISATFLDRLFNDPFFKGLSFIIGVLVFFITTSTFIMDTISFRKKRNNYD